MNPTRRMNQAIREAALAANKFGGVGSGSGMQPVFALGNKAGGAQGGYSTANSTTWTDITNTTFTFTLPAPAFLLYWVYGAAHISAGAGNGFFRGSIVSYDNTASPFVNSAATENGTMPYISPGVVPPGTYTAKMQAATDAGTTITIDQFFHLIFMLGF